MATPFQLMTAAVTAHLFAPGRRTSICGQVVNARRLRGAHAEDRRCATCLRPVLRCAVCGRGVQLRADGTAKRHHDGAPSECRGTGQQPVKAAVAAVVPVAVWLVDVSIKLRPDRVIAHRYEPGELRSLCGHGFRTRGHSFRRPTEADHRCQACTQKITTTSGRTR